MKFLLLSTLISCGSDIIISTKVEEKTQDTSDVVVVEETATPAPATEPSSPTSEPESQMTDYSVGLATIHFRQIACPACVGAYGEFEISANLKMHQPTNLEHSPTHPCTTRRLSSSQSGKPRLMQRQLVREREQTRSNLAHSLK